MDGTATAPDDYGSLSFNLPFLVGSRATAVNLGTVDDSIFEDRETFSVTLSNPTNGLTLGSQVTIEVIIEDNEGIDKATLTNA